MKDIRIQLNSTKEIAVFNKILNGYECDFDLEVGRNYVDAKSLLGLYSLSLQRPMTLHIQAEELMSDEIIEDLSDFICEDGLVCEY